MRPCRQSRQGWHEGVARSAKSFGTPLFLISGVPKQLKKNIYKARTIDLTTFNSIQRAEKHLITFFRKDENSYDSYSWY